MNRKIKYTILLALSGVMFLSCKKDKQPTLYMGYDYFPNNVGHYVIYQCDSIIVNVLDGKTPPFDTFKYQIKEVIDSLYHNNQGQLTQRIVRYKRINDTLPWTSLAVTEKVWTGNLLSNIAIRQEDNYQYIKLAFPVSQGKSWDGNALNTIGDWNYTYTAINTPAIINGTRFDSTLTVMQQNSSGILFYQYYYEQYATRVGLIYKEVIDWQTSKFSFMSPPPVDSATSGTILYTETYLSSGNQ